MKRSAVSLAVALGVLGACEGARSPARSEDACALACEQRIPRCGPAACARGCTLALDRLLEHEGETVVACVAASRSACDDWLWAECAAKVGPHLDGGPPPPVSGPRH